MERRSILALGHARRRSVWYLPRPVRRDLSDMQIPWRRLLTVYVLSPAIN